MSCSPCTVSWTAHIINSNLKMYAWKRGIGYHTVDSIYINSRLLRTCHTRKYKTPKIPGTKSATQRPIPPTFSVKLAFHPVKIRTDSRSTRNRRSTSSANNVPLGNGRTEKNSAMTVITVEGSKHLSHNLNKIVYLWICREAGVLLWEQTLQSNKIRDAVVFEKLKSFSFFLYVMNNEKGARTTIEGKL